MEGKDIQLSYIVNTMAADVLAMQGVTAPGRYLN